MKICFFSPLKDREAFHYNQFYAQDVRILESIADELVLATRWSEIPWDADIYFVWWWTWAILPLLKAKFRLKPVVITGVLDLDNPMPTMGYSRRWWLQRLCIRAALGLSDANIFVSQLEFLRVPKVLPTRHPHYAPLVVDADLHPYSASPRNHFLLTICWLQGDNAARKGVDLAIRGHAKLLETYPALKLVVVGSHGDALPQLQSLAQALGSAGSVSFPGRVEHDEKVRLLHACAAYVQPSLFEGFGVAAAEAMASGAPVVVCRVGALPEVLGDDAYFMRDRTPAAFADAVQELITRPDPVRLARASQRIQDRFSYQNRRRYLDAVIRATL